MSSAQWVCHVIYHHAGTWPTDDHVTIYLSPYLPSTLQSLTTIHNRPHHNDGGLDNEIWHEDLLSNNECLYTTYHTCEESEERRANSGELIYVLFFPFLISNLNRP